MGLELTGERTLPGIWYENYWFARHMAAYRFAAVRCADRSMLDAGCGEGYGTALLARSASRAVGVDLVPDVVAHAARAYPHVQFIEAELGDVPYPDASFDVVVSFQVIEHLWDVSAYLAEMARLLAPGGMFLCTTVNRRTFTPGKDRPTNPFHVREFAAAELAGELSSTFEVTQVVGLHHGWRLRAVELLAAQSMPELLHTPPSAWPPWLRAVVRAVRPGDFRWRHGLVDHSLDLMVIGTPPTLATT